MQKFLYKSFLFFLPLAISYAILECANREIPNEYTTKVENFENSLNEIEVLVFGSSHALRGINPEHFTNFNTYNMAMVSQPLQIDYAILEKYKKDLINLKVLILTISHFTLSKDINEGEIANRIPFYHHFYGLNTLSGSDFESYSILPAIGYTKAVTIAYKYFISDNTKKVKTDKYGYMGEGGFLANDSITFEEDALASTYRHEDFSYDFNDNLTLLNDMLIWTKSNHVKVLLIETPKTIEYQKKLDNKKIASIDSTLILLESKFSNVKYIDFTHLYKDKKYFRNSDHLNEFGAKEFSLLLNEKINELIKK